MAIAAYYEPLNRNNEVPVCQTLFLWGELAILRQVMAGLILVIAYVPGIWEGFICDGVDAEYSSMLPEPR